MMRHISEIIREMDLKRYEDYVENHGQDHDDEIREEKEAMDVRDYFDEHYP